MKLFITRHGETEWNRQGRMQGWKNSDLTEKGILNARKLGESLKNIEFECIYTSPSGRAVDTARYIRGNKNTEITIKDSLKEMGFGLWEGMEHSKVEELYPEQKYNLWNKPHLYEPVGGETYPELLTRAKSVLEEFINENKYGNVLIVSHAIFIKAVYAVVRKYALEDFCNTPFMNDTCLTILEIEGDKIDVILEADTSHLD